MYSLTLCTRPQSLKLQSPLPVARQRKHHDPSPREQQPWQTGESTAPSSVLADEGLEPCKAWGTTILVLTCDQVGQNSGACNSRNKLVFPCAPGSITIANEVLRCVQKHPTMSGRRQALSEERAKSHASTDTYRATLQAGQYTVDYSVDPAYKWLTSLEPPSAGST